jgi:hypothetical protein
MLGVPEMIDPAAVEPPTVAPGEEDDELELPE